MLDCNMNDTDSSSVALEALKEMESRLHSTQLELEDFKLKVYRAMSHLITSFSLLNMALDDFR